MADAITTIRRQDQAVPAAHAGLAQLDEALGAHAEALLAALRALQALNDRGALTLLAALGEQADAVGKIGVSLLAQPEGTRVLQNLVSIVTLLGQIDPAQLRTIVQASGKAMEAAAKQMENSKGLGVLGAMRLLRDPDVSRGLRMVSGILGALGAASPEATS